MGEDDASISDAPSSRAPAFAAPATTTTAPAAVVVPVPETTTRPGVEAQPPPVAKAPAPGPATPARSALAPAQPGTYRYDTSGQTGFGTASSPLPAVTTLVVDPPVGTTQRSTRDLRDASRNGPVLQTVLDYRPDGVYLVSLDVTATFLVFTETRQLRPTSPILLLPTDAAVGLHREFDLPTSQPGLSPAHLTLDVVRQEQVTVAGQAVATTVVRLAATIPGPLTGRLELTVWVAPAYRLWVKERSTGEATGPEDQVVYRSDYEATLQRLTPS